MLVHMGVCGWVYGRDGPCAALTGVRNLDPGTFCFDAPDTGGSWKMVLVQDLGEKDFIRDVLAGHATTAQADALEDCVVIDP